MKRLRTQLLVTCLALSACTSIQWVPIPDPSTSIEDSGKARIRVARPGAVFLSGVQRVVVDDGEGVGLLRNDGHLIWEREPGAAVIGLGGRYFEQFSASWERYRPVDLELELEAGSTYTLQASPMRGGTAESRKEEAGDAHVAWSEGHEVWELRLLDDEEGDEVIRTTGPARFEERDPEDEPELYEGPGISLPVPPFGEHVIESQDGNGVAFVNRYGHTLFVEWHPWPAETPVPTTTIGLEGEILSRMDASDTHEVLYSERLEGETPMVYVVLRVPQGSLATVSEGGQSERPDADRGLLVFPKDNTLYALSWQWGPIPGFDRSGEEEWARWRDRLLALQGTIRLDGAAIYTSP